MPEQTAEKACRAGWLMLLSLLLQLRHLRLGLLKRNVLHQHSLGEYIERVRVGPERAIQQGFGIGIFFLQLSLIDALDERVEKLFFLGSQRSILRRQQNCGCAALRD